MSRVSSWEVEVIHADSNEWMTIELNEELWDDEPDLTAKDAIEIIKSGIIYRAKPLEVE